jgi:hypothetical protein
MSKSYRSYLKLLICFAWGIWGLLCGFGPGPLPAVQAAANEPVPAGPAQWIAEIIRYGAMAPSSHNAQMWQVKRLSDQEILILLDPARLLPQVDPWNREALISVGAFVENMVAAAPHFDLEAEVQILVRRPGDTSIASLRFTPRPGGPDAARLAAAIENRHTIRTPYSKSALPESVLEQFRAVQPGIRYFPLASPEGRYLREAIIEATRQQVANDAKQRELAEWLRFSKKEADTKKDGLTPEMMGLSGIVKWFASTFFNRDTVLSGSFRKQTVGTVQKQVQNCAGFIVISSPDETPAALVNAGRTLERLWIRATGLQVAVHPMSAPLEENPWRETLPARLKMGQPVQMILRVGTVRDYGRPVSPRREVPLQK